MTAFSGSLHLEYAMLNINTQLLLLQLLNQELRKADRRATRLYYEEILEAKADFIEHAKTLGPDNEKR